MYVSLSFFPLLAFSPSLLFFCALADVSWLSVRAPSPFFLFGLPFPCFVLSLLACFSVAIQECLVLYSCSPCFYSLAVVSASPQQYLVFEFDFRSFILYGYQIRFIIFIFVLSSFQSTYDITDSAAPRHALSVYIYICYGRVSAVINASRSLPFPFFRPSIPYCIRARTRTCPFAFAWRYNTLAPKSATGWGCWK